MHEGGDTRRIPLAIVGMACRLPGADDLAQFWNLLVEGRSAIADLPPERLDQELYYDPQRGAGNKTYTRRGAIANQQFDPDRCPISPELVRRADPTHLVMCQVAAEAMRHAGWDPFHLALRNAGVYVGHTIGSGLEGDRAYAQGIEEAAERLRSVGPFGDLSPQQQDAVSRGLIDAVHGQYPPHAYDDRDIASHMAAGVISKAFNLNGPSMAVNAACASSLAALLLAARALQRGQIEMAVVGGASVCREEWLLLFSPAQSMSPTLARPFDHRADGLIAAEGYVALVLKTLERALADGDTIHAVIRGAGVSSDGKGRSLWAPRREGQVEAVRRAYGSNVDIADLQYIEAHATATRVGDATEIASLTEVLRDVFPPGKKIPITSVKANIGHTLEAAGLAGVLKAVLCMKKAMIPPAIQIERLNPDIDWAAAPVFVPTQPTPWPEPADGKPRRSGVSAFGIGGLNVHVVLDSHVSASAVAATHGDPDDDAIAVIGTGCVFPGQGDALRVPLTACQPVSSATTDEHVRDFHYDWRRHKIPPKQIEHADPLQFMVLEAADQALADSGYDRKPFDRKRTGVVVGTAFAGDFTFHMQLPLRLPHMARILRGLLAQQGQSPQQIGRVEQAFADAVHAKWPALLDETGSFSAASLAVRVAKVWDLMGGAMALDSVSASSATNSRPATPSIESGRAAPEVRADTARLNRCDEKGDYQSAALDAAMDLLLAGDLDLAVYAQTERHATLAASGSTPSEGAGALLLKRLADARRDGDRIHAVLRRAGSGDAKQTHPAQRVGFAAACEAPASVDAKVILLGEAEALTGYPPEVLELDADLETDLAIDRATTSRIIAETRSRLGMPTDEQVKLDEFRTLRHVLESLRSDGAPQRVAHRSVLRLADAPLPVGETSIYVPRGAAIVLGENPAADALCRRLAAQGAPVHHLLPSAGVDAVLAQMDQLPTEPASRHIFIMTAMDPGAGELSDPASWALRRQLGVELPYLVLQKWGQRLARNQVAGPLTLAAGTLLGGDLGLAEPVVAPEGGWIAGLLKSLHVELNRHERQTRTKICDFSAQDAPDVIAEAMLRELASTGPEVEVSLAAGRRRIVRSVPAPASGLPRSEIRRGATWVITGGARGITAEVAVKLGQECNLDLHLIGRSPVPREDAPWRNCSDEELKQIKRSIVRQAIAEKRSPEKQWDRVKADIEIHNNLQRMRKLGLRVTYHSCNLADSAALADVLQAIRQSGGPIEGIIHGAGYARTSRFENQKRDELQATIGAKVDGALGLMLLTRADPVRYFVGFGSISGRFGGNGLSDYAAANEMLAKLCAWHRRLRPDCASACIAWQSWDEVGMAMLPDSTVGTRDVLKMKFIPPAEGIEHLRQELLVGLPEREVLIDDGQFEQLLWRSS